MACTVWSSVMMKTMFGLPISLFLAFAFGVALTLWILQQGLPTVAEREDAGERLEKLFEQYEEVRLPPDNKDQVVSSIRAILTELGLLADLDEQEAPEAPAGEGDKEPDGAGTE